MIKLLIVGIDGYSDRAYYDPEVPAAFLRRVLRPKSLLGTSKPFIQKDKSGRLDPHTGPNWSSIYTGVNPKVHGVDYGGWLFEHKSHGDLKVRSIWYDIRDKFRLGMVGMPVTYPAFECQWMISGFPNSRITPKSVYPHDLKLGKKFKVDYGDGETSWRDRLMEKWDEGEFAKFMNIEEEKFELVKKLHAIDPIDVLAFGTTVVDKSCHLFTLFSKQSFEVYRRVDSLVQRLFEHFEPEQVIIVSDHGFRAMEGRHNDHGFYLWYDRKNDKPEMKSIRITETTKMILTALELDWGMIGKENKQEEKYEQEDVEFIEHNMRELGYL